MNKKLSCVAAIIALTSCSAGMQLPATKTQDPARFSYTRIHCTPDNESHFDTVTTDLARVDAAPPAMPFYARGSAATRVAFAAFEPGWGEQDEIARKHHPAPAAQYVVYLTGRMSIRTSDGQRREFNAGDVLRTEDVAPCKGHISVVGAAPVHTMVVR